MQIDLTPEEQGMVHMAIMNIEKFHTREAAEICASVERKLGATVHIVEHGNVFSLRVRNFPRFENRT